jgi:glycosyltransferase involved in cell wall biosynthesis
MMPSVSIIIPAYNCEKDIGVTLDSLLAQTYKDWQAVVVVAPSDDNTLEAVRRYSWDRRIFVVVETEKSNVATARNDGIYLATGRYVAFLDAGDWWVKAKLSCCVYLLADTSIPWCYHHMIIHEGSSEKLWAERPGQSVGIEGLHTVFVRRDVLDEIKNESGFATTKLSFGTNSNSSFALLRQSERTHRNNIKNAEYHAGSFHGRKEWCVVPDTVSCEKLRALLSGTFEEALP